MEILLLLMSPLVLIASAQDVETNNKCSYSLGKRVFTCSGLTDVNKNIDQFLTPNTRMLVIKNSERAKFTSYYHDDINYQYVLNYNIIENNQLEIEQRAFYGMVNLRYLKINRNVLATIRNNTFRGLDELELLNLADNNLTTIEKGAFRDLRNLITLDIADNNLEVIPSNLFGDLESLKTLLLEHNNINIIETNGFAGIPDVDLLDLSYNALNKLNANDFNVLQSLHTLYLNFNKIEEISGNFDLPKLKFLQLDNNKLKAIHEDIFKGMKSILSMDLSSNELVVNDKPFLSLWSLRHLNLKANNVNASTFTELKKSVSVIL